MFKELLYAHVLSALTMWYSGNYKRLCTKGCMHASVKQEVMIATRPTQVVNLQKKQFQTPTAHRYCTLLNENWGQALHVSLPI